MSARSPYKNWYVAASVLVLTLALVACSPFGKQKAAEPTATNVPPPTETPIPVLPTYTATAVPQPATPTPTEVPASTAAAEPTLTPTPKPTAEPQVGGEQPVAAVVYKVTKVPTEGDVVQNGSFEDGFDENGVPQGWTAYSNDDAVYTWQDETDLKHISHDAHALLMRLMGPGEPDRFVGIHQTVDVVAGETYTLSLHGLIRSSTAGGDQNPYGHRMQWAIDDGSTKGWYEVNQDWAAWKDTGWNDVGLKEKKPVVNVYIDHVAPESDKLTLYVRGWTKWPNINSEAMYYLDGISLQGPVPGEETVIKVAATTGSAGTEEMPTTGGSAVWIPIVGIIFVLGFAFWEIRKVWLR